MNTAERNNLFNFQVLATHEDYSNIFEKNMHQEICIKEGLWLSYMSNYSPKAIKIRYERKYPVINFGFIVSGKIKKYSEDDECKNNGVNVENGISGIQFTKEKRGSFLLEAGREQKNLHLHITIPFFQKIIKNDYGKLPKQLKNIAERELDREFYFTQEMHPEIQSVVCQILNYLDGNLVWPLYLEGKILELISLQMLSFSEKKKRGLSKADKQKIFKAKEFLIRDLVNPPTLRQICTYTGLSMNKLQLGFRALYGKTVFEYFRDYRMQTAKLLMEEKGYNVSETAWEIGYININHFSSAFKKRFGVLPKQYLKTLKC